MLPWFRRRAGLVMVLLLCAGAVVLQTGPAAAATTASFSTTSSWDTGYEGEYMIANTGPGPITGWRVEFDLPASTTVGTFWDALMTRSGNHYTFTNRDYNATVAVGGSVAFGLVAAGTTLPANCRLNGAACGGGGGATTTTRPPGPTTSSEASRASAPEPVAGGERAPDHERMRPENGRRDGNPPAGQQPSPPAAGVRLAWADMPADLRRAIEDDLGSRVTEAVTQPGGFSPGVASRLLLADGRRAFVKAVSSEANPDSPNLHRAEARITASLPAEAPAPRLLASYDRDGWVALVLEDVDGALPAQPWRMDQLERVLNALADLASALTPAPCEAPTAAERLRESFNGWRSARAAFHGGEDPSWLDPWALRNLERLVALESDWERAAAGTTLLHGDIRADNLLLTPDRVVVVDWPWASIGAPWLDLLAMLPSVRMQGGPDPDAVLTAHPVARGADPEAIDAVLAGLAGFFIWQAHLPPPPGIPTVRAFQAAQGQVALDWLRSRTAWD